MALITAGLQWGWGEPLSGLFVLPSMPADGLQFDIAMGVGGGLAVVVLWRVTAQGYRWAQEMEGEFRAVLGHLTSGEIFALSDLLSGGQEEVDDETLGLTLAGDAGHALAEGEQIFAKPEAYGVAQGRRGDGGLAGGRHQRGEGLPIFAG